MSDVEIRAATAADDDAIWALLQAAIAPGDAFVYARDAARSEVMADWTGPGHTTFVATGDGAVLGAGFVRASYPGRGAHVANAGYAVAPAARGRGIARRLCEHSLEIAREAGFATMQFNYVVSTNDAAVRAWTACGFSIAGRLPAAFRHETLGDVDILVMHRFL